jgi:hypothetical protein
MRAAVAERVNAVSAAGPGGPVVALILAKTLLVILPPVLVIGLIAGRRVKLIAQAASRGNPLVRFFTLYFGLVLALLAFAGLATDATHFRMRWAQPFFLFVPVWLMLMLRGEGYEVLSRKLAGAAAGVAVLLGAAFQVMLIAGPALGHTARLNDPFEALAMALPPTDGDILVENHYLGGNLKLWVGQAAIYTPQFGFRPRHLRPGCTLLVWNATDGHEPPRALLELAKAHGKTPDTATPVYIERTYARAAGKSMRLGVLEL